MIVFAIKLNASSTFVESLAEVSMKGIDRLSAKSCQRERTFKMARLEVWLTGETDLRHRVLDNLFLHQI